MGFLMGIRAIPPYSVLAAATLCIMCVLCCPRVALPALVPLSTEVLYPQGAYLMDNGRIFVLWLGREVSPQFLQEVRPADTANQHSGYPAFPISSFPL